MSLFKVLEPLAPSQDKSHHIGSPRTHFCNPWSSFPTTHADLASILRTRFGAKPPFVPIPQRSELVQIQPPDFSTPSHTTGYKVTWIGHASFLVQCFSPTYSRPMGILLDPVFSERTSPVTFFGPKRYTPTPCSISELLDAVRIDIVCISHNHYDHADTTTLQTIFDHHRNIGVKVLFCTALRNSRWLAPLGIPSEQIWEADWWDRIEIPLPVCTPKSHLQTGQSDPNITTSGQDRASFQTSNGQSFVLICTPSQHASKRGLFDGNSDLWCSWALKMTSPSTNFSGTASLKTQKQTRQTTPHMKSLFFAGDTGYRNVPLDATGDLSSLPVCPAFKEIGNTLGPFDIALLPIGLNRPRHFMSPVHANAEDSICIHQDIKSLKSIGMHWGTVRGGLSAYYEDVRDPPKEWEEEALKAGLKFRDRKSQASLNSDGSSPDENLNDKEWEIGLIDVGESLVL